MNYREIKLFADKIFEKDMNVLFLGLLRACCSCAGRGVAKNQTLVSECFFSDGQKNVFFDVEADYENLVSTDSGAIVSILTPVRPRLPSGSAASPTPVRPRLASGGVSSPTNRPRAPSGSTPTAAAAATRALTPLEIWTSEVHPYSYHDLTMHWPNIGHTLPILVLCSSSTMFILLLHSNPILFVFNSL